MTRPYRQRARAATSARTRGRILAVVRASLSDAADLQVDVIARKAKVSVPTLYSHFGSKRGLLSALIGEIEREAGLFAGFEQVWQCPDGESALRLMLEATLDFWHQAWTFVRFGLRVRRADPELEAGFKRLDASRLGHLAVISRRLGNEGRLRENLTPGAAARLAFAMSTPYVYEAMVIEGRLPVSTARRLAVDAIVEAVLRPGTQPVRKPAADWLRLGLKPPVTG